MNTAFWLRVAAVISLFFALGHTLGGRRDWSPMGDNEVLRAMKSSRFETMGVVRTYHDFYTGFGYLLSVAMLLQTVLLWQLASLAQPGAASVRPLIGAFLLAAAANAILSWELLFPVPAAFSVALGVFLALAFLSKP